MRGESPFPCSQERLTVSYPESVNPVYTLTSHCFNIHFNIILLFRVLQCDLFPGGFLTKILYVFPSTSVYKKLSLSSRSHYTQNQPTN